jgi:hypothetical protein
VAVSQLAGGGAASDGAGDIDSSDRCMNV